MKKIIILLGSFLLINGFIGCSNQSSAETKTEQTKEHSVPEGWEEGQIKEYIGKDKQEENMLSQVRTYYLSLLRADIKNAAHYMYEDCIPYYRKYYFSDLDDDEIINEFFKPISDVMIKSNEAYEKQGLEFNIINTGIARKTEISDTLLYIFTCTAQVVGEKKDGTTAYLHTKGKEETLGISFDDGKTWKFMSINDDTPNVLRMRFSEDIINKVMGY